MVRLQKRKIRPPSVHSRAARRAPSPTPGISGLTKDTSSSRPETSKAFFSPSSTGAIQKKKKSRAESRQQRVRREKAMDRAANFTERLETKTTKSKDRGKTIKSRAVDWNLLNGATESDGVSDAARAEASAGVESMEEDQNESEDDENESEDQETALPDPRLALVQHDDPVADEDDDNVL